MWMMPYVGKISLYGRESINCGLQKAGLFYDVILYQKHFMWCWIKFFKAWGRIMQMLGFIWRKDCVLFNLLECFLKILSLTQYVIKSDNAKFLHESITYVSLCFYCPSWGKCTSVYIVKFSKAAEHIFCWGCVYVKENSVLKVLLYMNRPLQS